MAIRQFDFIVGPETSALPALGTVDSGTDVITLDYARLLSSTFSSPEPITVAGVTTSDAVTEIMYVVGSPGAVNITANPQISAPPTAGTRDGQRLILIGTHDTNTVLLEHGNGLNINGNMLLKSGASIELIFDNGTTTWFEICRTER